MIKRNKTISFTLSDQDHAQMEALAELDSITLSEYLHRIAIAHLAELRAETMMRMDIFMGNENRI